MKNAVFKTSCLFKCVYICSLNVFLTRRKRSVMTLKIIIKGKNVYILEQPTIERRSTHQTKTNKNDKVNGKHAVTT